VPKVTDEYRRARRDEILAGALRAFHRNGFAATSMADILEETGVSAGALYGHFKSKEELVKEVASSIVAGRLIDADALLALDPLPHPGELVGIFLRGALAELKQPSMLVQMWGQAVTEPEFQNVAVTIITRLEGVFHRHISAWQQQEHGLSVAEADRIATEQTPLFISVCQGFMLQLSIKPGFDIDKYLSAAAKYLPR
jgi:AcrR family transcriptional regulator